MDMIQDFSFKKLTTMKLGGNTKFLTNINNSDDAAKVCHYAKVLHLPIFIIGGGSNVIAKDTGFDGLTIKMRIKGFEVLSEDDNSKTIRIGAGENWDEVVEKCVSQKLSGIETMSGIPGTVGATPIQNVGAYGQEIADTLQYIEAFDIKNEKFAVIHKSDCGFSYRQSIFKDKDLGRYMITYIVIKLHKSEPKPPFYKALQDYLDKTNTKNYTVRTIRQAVLDIRRSKLPDPSLLPNSGSFFHNAIINSDQLKALKEFEPDVPTFDMGHGNFKIPTGWLIEKAGLKGSLINGIRIYDKNALVLVNESANSYSDLSTARDKIISTVFEKFNIKIQQEPLEI